MLTTHAHSTDVNVISWNRSEPLLVSGGDDGCLKIWDLRQFSKYKIGVCVAIVCVTSVWHRGEVAAVFHHHIAAVTSVEWAWHDPTVFASSGADNQVGTPPCGAKVLRWRPPCPPRWCSGTLQWRETKDRERVR